MMDKLYMADTPELLVQLSLGLLISSAAVDGSYFQLMRAFCMPSDARHRK